MCFINSKVNEDHTAQFSQNMISAKIRFINNCKYCENIQQKQKLFLAKTNELLIGFHNFNLILKYLKKYKNMCESYN